MRLEITFPTVLELASALTDRGVMPDRAVLRDLFSNHEWETVTEWAREAGVPVSGLMDLQPWVVELLATELGATSSNLSAANRRRRRARTEDRPEL